MSTRDQAAAALRSADPDGRWSLAELALRAESDIFARNAWEAWEAHLASFYERPGRNKAPA